MHENEREKAPRKIEQVLLWKYMLYATSGETIKAKVMSKDLFPQIIISVASTMRTETLFIGGLF